jgi:hypothetical protein
MDDRGNILTNDGEWYLRTLLTGEPLYEAREALSHIRAMDGGPHHPANREIGTLVLKNAQQMVNMRTKKVEELYAQIERLLRPFEGLMV